MCSVAGDERKTIQVSNFLEKIVGILMMKDISKAWNRENVFHQGDERRYESCGE